MRSDEAARQMTALELILSKVSVRLGLGNSDAEIVEALSNALLEAYRLGGVEALEVAPFEVVVFASETHPTADEVNKVSAHGWEPFSICQGMVKASGFPGLKAKHVPGWVIWCKRRTQPKTEGAALVASEA